MVEVRTTAAADAEEALRADELADAAVDGAVALPPLRGAVPGPHVRRPAPLLLDLEVVDLRLV